MYMYKIIIYHLIFNYYLIIKFLIISSEIFYKHKFDMYNFYFILIFIITIILY